MLTSTPTLLRFFTLILSALSILRYKSWRAAPMSTLNALSKQVLKMTFIISSAIGTAWTSICLFQNFLPRKMIPQWRFFVGGFLGGLFAFFGREKGRGLAIYAARTSADSLWKVGVKRRWWKEVKGGGIFVFAASLALMGAVMERNQGALGKGWERIALEIVRGDRELGLNAQEERSVEFAVDSAVDKASNDTQPREEVTPDNNETSIRGEEGDWQEVVGKEES